MSWKLFIQLLILLMVAYVLTYAIIGAVIDKMREDAHHRKVNGL